MSNSKHVVDTSFDASFESKIPVGGLVQIEYANRKYFSMLRGAMFSKYILVDIPVFKGRPVVFHFRAALTLRFLLAGTVYGLKAGILRLHTKPPILVLDYPESVSKNNLRKGERIKILLPIKVTIQGRSEAIKGVILDLSANGALCSLKTEPKLENGQWMLISMTLPGDSVIESIVCYIRNIRRQEGKNVFGILFDDKNKYAMDFIRAFYDDCCYIHSSQEEQGKNNHAEKEGLFNIGQEINLELQKKTITTTLRGWKQWRDGGYFLLEAPSIAEIRQVPKSGSDIIARYMAGDKVCGAATQFRTALPKTNLWMLKFGEDVVECSLRGDERFYCLLPVILTESKDGKTKEIGNGLIGYISLCGARIITKEQIFLPANDIVNISFMLNDTGAIESQKFKVLRKARQSENFEYAGMFVDMEEEDKEKLYKFFDFCREWLLE